MKETVRPQKQKSDVPALKVRISPIPYYAQVKNALRDQILDGSLTPHDQMPSEYQMVDMFGVSRITIRQALKDLENEGLVFRVHGKGTFVAKPKAFQNLTQLQSFGEAMQPLGFETYSKLIAIKVVPANLQVAERLALGKGEKVTEIKRVRYLNREPMSYETSYFPNQIGTRLAREDLSSRDILLILEDDYGIRLGHADLVLGAHLASQEQAKLLGIESGAALLHIERLTHDDNGGPLMHEHLFHRGDFFRYTARVDRVRVRL